MEPAHLNPFALARPGKGRAELPEAIFRNTAVSPTQKKREERSHGESGCAFCLKITERCCSKITEKEKQEKSAALRLNRSCGTGQLRNARR